jgi:Zn-dependent protease
MFALKPMVGMLAASVWINIMLAVFNCLPIPPLDGSKVLMGILPPEAARSYARLEPFGFILLLVLFYAGLLNKIIMPIINFANTLLLG